MSGDRAASATPARRAAFEVLRRVFEHGAWADRAFPAAAKRHGLAGRERSHGQLLAFGAVKRKGTSDHVAAGLLDRSLERLDEPVLAALRLGLFELLQTGGVADHAAVDGAVELAKGGMGRRGAARARAASGLVNAVLRRAAAERERITRELSDGTPAEAAVAHSVPEWIAELWWRELGEDDARALLCAANEPAETAMRAGRGADALREQLAAAGEPVVPGAAVSGVGKLPGALVWSGPLGAGAREALDRGGMVAQSRGSQAVVATLDPQLGERVLDLCAGPGVKTTDIASRVGAAGEVVAVERNADRAAMVEELAERTGAANVRVIVGDAADVAREVGACEFDRVLVDPPCSDLGTLGSRPDVRWRKSPELIASVAAEQHRILSAAVAPLRAGGTLVYSTCTISRAENEEVIDGLLAAAGDVEPAERLAIRPDRDGTDAFFVARLRRVG